MPDVEIPSLLGGEAVHDLTALCYQMLGPAMTRGDAQGDWMLLKFMDALVHHLKPVWDLVLDNPARPGWWDAFNPEAVPGEVLPWLPWMAQFTGDYYDPSVNGIDPTAVHPDQVNRNKVARRRQWHRGTVAVIEETILERLPAGALVQVTERYQGSKSHMHILLYTASDIPTDIRGAILQAVAASIPAGDTFDLDVLISPSFGTVEAGLTTDTMGDLQSKYPRFADWPTIHEAPYLGVLPREATEPAVTTWTQIEQRIGSWSAITAYGSWEAIETAGDIFNLEG